MIIKNHTSNNRSNPKKNLIQLGKTTSICLTRIKAHEAHLHKQVKRKPEKASFKTIPFIEDQKRELFKWKLYFVQ